MKSIIRKSIRLMRKGFYYLLIKLLLKPLKLNVLISYDDGGKIDGTGAQIQRLLAIYGVSKFVGLKHVFSGIKEIAIHPLDPFQSIPEMRNFVDQINSVFELPSDEISNDCLEIRCSSLNLRVLFKALLISIREQRQVMIFCCETYCFADLFPSIYRISVENLLNWETFLRKVRRGFPHSPYIALHYRQGVGGTVIQKGEKFPRQMSLDYFQRKLEGVSGLASKKIFVFTDAPQTDIQYRIPLSQANLWLTNPRVAGDRMFIETTDFSTFLTQYGSAIEVISGGNPLDAIAQMSEAEILLMGRSSLSYVGGLLNRTGTVIFPPHFWHAPLKSWTKG